MKPNEFLKTIFPSPSFCDDTIKGKDLESIVPVLLKLDEFKGVNAINVMHSPTDAPTFKFNQETKFGSVINLYSIHLTPKIYDPTSLLLKGKTDGVWLLPTMIDNLVPYNEIKIRWNPENWSDCPVDAKIEEILKQTRDFLTRIKESNIPGKRAILIRCSFGSIAGNAVRQEEDCYVTA